MCQKKNIGKVLLGAYSSADMNGFSNKNTNYKSDLWTIKLNYLEMLLSQKELINSLSVQDKISLLKAALDKYSNKLKYPKFSSLYGVITILRLIAIDLDNLQGLEAVPSDKRQKIQNFIDSSKLTEETTVADILNYSHEYLKNK